MTRPAPETVTLHVPFRIAKRGGRKEIQLPPGAPAQRTVDNTMIKALGRAFRWKRMLESGDFATINELAEKEGIAPSYMTRVLRLTLLAPDMVEAILDGRTGPEITLARLLEGFPVKWREQGAALSRDENRGTHPARKMPFVRPGARCRPGRCRAANGCIACVHCRVPTCIYG